MRDAGKKKNPRRALILAAAALVVLAVLLFVLNGVFHKCGDHVTWSFDRKTGEMVIRGTGPMWDFESDQHSNTNRSTAPWKRIDGGITSVTVEEGVTSVGDYAFAYCAGLTGADLAESVTSIGDEAFYGCDALCELDLPEGLTSLEGAFWGSSIQSLRIPAGVSELWGSIFDGMDRLEEIVIDPDNPNYTVVDGAVYTADMKTLVRFPPAMACGRLTVPEGVTETGDCAFRFCGKLEAVTLPESLTSIGWAAFEGCSSLSDVNIPAGVTELPGDVFSDCSSLDSFTVPGTVRRIGNYAFSSTGAEYIEVEEGVESIGTYAFGGNFDMTGISLPSTLTEIRGDAFESCRFLTDVYYAGTVSEWTALAGSLSFDSENGVTVWCSDGQYYG